MDKTGELWVFHPLLFMLLWLGMLIGLLGSALFLKIMRSRFRGAIRGGGWGKEALFALGITAMQAAIVWGTYRYLHTGFARREDELTVGFVLALLVLGGAYRTTHHKEPNGAALAFIFLVQIASCLVILSIAPTILDLAIRMMAP